MTAPNLPMTTQPPEGPKGQRRYAPAALEALGLRLLSAAGLPEDAAREITAHVVDNSLCGMDSHGVVRLPYYLDLIAKGAVKAQSACCGRPNGHRRCVSPHHRCCSALPRLLVGFRSYAGTTPS